MRGNCIRSSKNIFKARISSLGNRMGSFHIVAEVVRRRAETEGSATSTKPLQPSVFKFPKEEQVKGSGAPNLQGEGSHEDNQVTKDRCAGL